MKKIKGIICVILTVILICGMAGCAGIQLGDLHKGAGEKVNPDSPEEAVSYIVGKLTEKHVI